MRVTTDPQAPFGPPSAPARTPPVESRPRRTLPADEIVLVLLALLLYAPGIMWGLPHATGELLVQPWGHDDITPLGPLAELHHTFVAAQADHWVAYPLMHYLVLAAAYLPYMVVLVASGGLADPSPVYPFGLADPRGALDVLTLIGRSVTLIMAVGIVLASFRIGRTLWDRRAGLLASLCVLLLLPMVYYSRTGNLDVPGLFWAMLTMLVAVRAVYHGYTVRRGIWIGLLAAAAAGTKDPYGAFLLLVPPALLVAHLRRCPEAGRRPGERWRPFAATVLAGLLAYVITSGFVFSPGRWVAHLRYITRSQPGIVPYEEYPATLAGYADFLGETGRWIVAAMSGSMLLVAAVGIVLALRRSPRALILLVPAVGLFVLMLLPLRMVEIRHTLPIAAMLAFFAGFAIADLWARGPVAVRALAIGLGVVVLGLPLARGIDLTHAMMRDARYEAARWLDARVADGERIAFFGASQKLPRLGTRVEYVRPVEFRGSAPTMTFTAEVLDDMARRIRNERSRYLLVIPDHSSRASFPQGITCPPAIHERLRDGALGYRLAVRIETPRLLPWARRPELVDYYPVVSPPVEVFERIQVTAGAWRR